MSASYKLNDKVEFLETSVKNWRWGKIVEINKKDKTYRIYSGTDMFIARPVTKNNKTQLETIS